jgi:hypothetical protein
MDKKITNKKGTITAKKQIKSSFPSEKKTLTPKQQQQVSVITKACSSLTQEQAAALRTELVCFGRLMQQKTGFDESQVYVYGNVPQEERRLLSSMCLVPEGIPFTVDGEVKLFDSAQHIAEFLQHGIPQQVDLWARGPQGVMSSYEKVFGEDQGKQMRESKWKEFVGIIPHMLVKPSRAALRASLGIEIKKTSSLSVASSALPIASSSSSSSSSLPQQKNKLQPGQQDNKPKPKMQEDHYDFWRPILHAKFAVPSLRQLLLSTGQKYLVEKDPHQESFGGAVVFDKPASTTENAKDCPAIKLFMKQKKEGTRTNGKLNGKNRMGRFLMAVRSEIRMSSFILDPSSSLSPSSLMCQAGKEKSGNDNDDGEKDSQSKKKEIPKEKEKEKEKERGGREGRGEGEAEPLKKKVKIA